MFSKSLIIIKRIKNLNTFFRRIILIFIDSILILSAVFFNFSLYDVNNFIDYKWILPTATIIGILIYISSGQYNSLSRYQSSDLIYKLSARNFLILILSSLFGITFELTSPTFSNWVLVWFLINIMTISFRLLLRDFLFSISFLKKRTKPEVVIYGAGDAGIQLLSAFRITQRFNVKAFIDDNPDLFNRDIYGVPIRPRSFLEKSNPKIERLFLAIPSLNYQKKISLLNELQRYSIPVFQIPSLENLTSGSLKIDDVRPININDLLSRKSVKPLPSLLFPAIENKVICVTGAGGSIGSELCRQIIKLNPSHLILIERHEPSLYFIKTELTNLNLNSKLDKKITYLLGSATDKNFIFNTFKDNSVDIVFHAAAYKHVPLVEENPRQGIYNNVFSTINVCSAALDLNISKVVLISTDKAVRPESIMGASKRLAELVVQGFSEKIKTSTKPINSKFSMVRFGNVLGSSGSVVPLFRKQIEQGGPITITEREMVRYFMTIREAAELVIQTSVLSEGGDVFLLDMGEPVKIIDLAQKMIRLSGLTIKSDNQQDGDIEIVITGKRLGEKLYEELLIDGKSIPTIHPLIFKANEKFIPEKELFEGIDELEKALINDNKENVLDILFKLIK